MQGLAKATGLARSRISLLSGDTARAKTLAVEGCTPQEEEALGRLSCP